MGSLPCVRTLCVHLALPVNPELVTVGNVTRGIRTGEVGHDTAIDPLCPLEALQVLSVCSVMLFDQLLGRAGASHFRCPFHGLDKMRRREAREAFRGGIISRCHGLVTWRRGGTRARPPQHPNSRLQIRHRIGIRPRRPLHPSLERRADERGAEIPGNVVADTSRHKISPRPIPLRRQGLAGPV